MRPRSDLHYAGPAQPHTAAGGGHTAGDDLYHDLSDLSELCNPYRGTARR